MKALIQRTKQAHVTVNDEVVGKINRGLLVFLGVTNDDQQKDIDYLVNKIANLRVLADSNKEFEKSINEESKEVLVISQFTLYAECKKGRRPDFNQSAKADIAEPLYLEFIEKLKEQGLKVETGIFGAEMQVHLINDGPVTIMLESPNTL